MSNHWFEFRQFRIDQPAGVFRVGTDGVLLGAWAGAGRSDAVSILDIGTGTGLIALMLAQRFPQALITAIEPDKESFEVATGNATASPWHDRITVINSSLDEYLSSGPEEYNLIVSNPPFYNHALKNPDPRKASFRHSGSLSVNDIVAAARSLLAGTGALSLVLPWAEGNVAVANAALAGLYCSRMTKVRPLAASPFNRLLLEVEREKPGCAVNILTLGHPSHGGYTRDYIELTRDFYPGF